MPVLVDRVARRFLADLTPPLGWPGGPCHVVQRIEDEVRTPALKEQLVDKAEHGEEITNPEAARIYHMENERGVGIVKKLMIGPHAQYRMDLRGVTVPQVRAALMTFSKFLNDWKAQQSPRYKAVAQRVERREPIEFTDPRMNLTIVFAIEDKTTAKLVTTWWEGEPDPPAPKHCDVPRVAGWEDAKSDVQKRYPDVDPRAAKLYDSASNLTRATHAQFQNAVSGIGEVSADLWEKIAEKYDEAVRLWNTVLTAGPKLGAHADELHDKAYAARRVCLEREREAKKRFRQALDTERIEENARWNRSAAQTKHPAVVTALIAFLRDGPYKSHLVLKTVRAGKAVLIPQGINSLVERVEISGLQGDKAEFVLFLTNGDSGWAWDEWRQPPKFHNDAGYNVIYLDRLDRIANPQTDPEKFQQHMMSLCKTTLVPAIQRAGWVIDPVTKKPMPLAQWVKTQPAPTKAPAPKPVPVQPPPSAKPSYTPSGGGWSRAFLDSYRALEKYLQVQGDAEGVGLLEAFGRRADDLNAFGSARLSLAFRAVETRLRATKDAKGLQLLDILGVAFDDMVDELTSRHDEDQDE